MLFLVVCACLANREWFSSAALSFPSVNYDIFFPSVVQRLVISVLSVAGKDLCMILILISFTIILSFMFSLHQNFTMLDIYNGDISYLHDGSDTSQDSFSIIVSDSTNKMYRHGRSEEVTVEPISVHVEISSVDDGTPILTANRGLHFLQQKDGKVGCSINKLHKHWPFDSFCKMFVPC